MTRGTWNLVCGVCALVGVAGVAAAQRSTPLELLHPSGAAGDRYGLAVAADGDTMVVGAPLDDVGSVSNQGSALVYRWTGGSWVLEATLTSADGSQGDNFGGAVAIQGDSVVVGARLDDVGNNTNQGRAYVFKRTGTTWTQQARLTASNGAATDQFGGAVAIQGDCIVIGAARDDVAGQADQGSVYIFRRGASGWSQEVQLTGAAGSGDEFGSSVAVSGDAVVVGAPLDDVSGAADRGSVYVFRRTAGVWNQESILTAADGTAGDQFGASVSMDGDAAAIGAVADDVGGAVDQGSAYVFTRAAGVWSQRQKLTGSGGAAGDNFGASVALWSGTVIVGAENAAVEGRAAQGHATVFVRSSDGLTWSEQQRLVSPRGDAGDQCGASVALAWNGDLAVVGGPFDAVGANAEQGSAWLFTRIGARWIGPDVTLTRSVTSADARMGMSISASSNWVLAGAPWEPSGSNVRQGAAYFYENTGSGWTEQARRTILAGAASDEFGTGVSISGDLAIIGAPGALVFGRSQGGAAWIFQRINGVWTERERLYDPLGQSSDRFGSRVAISGETVAIASGPFGRPGVVVIFAKVSQTWIEQARLMEPNAGNLSSFGCSISMSGDTLVVGAQGATVGFNQYQGAAYVYVRSAGVWALQTRLTASDGGWLDSFGISVSVKGDMVVAGAYAHDVEGRSNQGAAYVFARSAGVWTQQATLIATGGKASEQFGSSVAVSPDNTHIVVGANVATVTGANAQGCAYLFERTASGWVQQSHLYDSDASAGEHMGHSVAIEGDSVVVGVIDDDLNGVNSAGSLRVYDVNNCPSDDASWARNDMTQRMYPTLESAATAAADGEQITASPGAWRQASMVDTAGKSLQFESTGVIRMPSTSTLILDAASVLETAGNQPVELHGALLLPGQQQRIVRAPTLVLGVRASVSMDPGGEVLLPIGGFDCAITDHTRVQLSESTLALGRNSSIVKDIEAMSPDIGPSPLGLNPTLPGHCPIDFMRLGSGPCHIRLVDARDNDGLGQAEPEAIYVNTIRIDSGSRLDNAACKIYYRTLIPGGVVTVPANLIQIEDPCYADFNQDGGIDGADSDAFFAAWEAGDQAADVNLDGGVDGADVGVFFAAWEAGGCS